MSDFYIRDKEQAEAIIRAYNKCGICSECPLHTGEGWKCSYLYEKATKYLEKKAEA